MEKTVIFTPETISPQIAYLKEKYPSLNVVRSNSLTVQLHGDLPVCRSYAGFVLNKTYTIDIHVPLNSSEIPYVIDTGKAIARSYPHRYADGKLCLETDAHIKTRFLDGFDLVNWIFDYVEVYFFSYEYYTRYGEFPFGERKHGYKGRLQAYQELLSTADLDAAYRMMEYIGTHPYRGHISCPCGSNRHLRSCHGPNILKFYQDTRLMEILRQELKNINWEMNNK